MYQIPGLFNLVRGKHTLHSTDKDRYDQGSHFGAWWRFRFGLSIRRINPCATVIGTDFSLWNFIR